MRNILQIVPLLFAALIGVTLTGCAEKNPYGVVPVTGVVLTDGKPMDGIYVTFILTGGDGKTAGGITDAEGRFTLATAGSEMKGAVPGMYNVTFEKFTVNVVRDASGHESPAGKNFLIPERYGKPETSGIEPVTVERGKKNHFEFKLQGQ
ncbi:MAG: DUF4198 domain-containing protein [Planctomycetaceae bacterium]|nr:DUF4198 domain-containing protein [Planctomycetaceae bacterium]